jgi:hypothetical protein
MAVDDVHVAAPPSQATEVADFYTGLVGLRLLDPRPEDPALIFVGYSRVRPRLIVRLSEEDRPGLRGYVPVRVAALGPVQQLAHDRGIETTWTQSLSFFDRRLTISDPAGNRVELVAYHML